MTYMSKDKTVIAELREAVKDIRTVADLTEYLRTYRSPVVGDLIVSAVRFFLKECRKDDGKLDWKAIKERKRLGLKFQLTEEHEVTPEIISALWSWMCYPGYGRDIGTGFDENLLSSRDFGIGMPRYVAFDLLTLLREKMGAVR